jgi:HTH-type transcriptional regulator / antitoxin HigA
MDVYMKKGNYYEPDYSVHPGEYLEEILESREMKKREFAERVGLSAKAVSQILHGKALYSPEVALRFERVLGISASIWSGMAERYQLYAAKEKEQRTLKEDHVAEWVKRFPVTELKKLKILPDTRNPAELAEALFRFLGVSSIESWESLAHSRVTAYRQSGSHTISREAVDIWLTIAEREAELIDTEPFDKKQFKESLCTIRTFTKKDPDDFFPQMVKVLAEVGVALVVVPELKGCRISGATRWLTPTRAMIALSLRYKTNDQFWFTFYHEAAHLVLHAKKIFIDQHGGDDRKEEKEADEYAVNMLIPQAEYTKFIAGGLFSENTIRRFAENIGIHPALVVGRLQHDGRLDFKYHNSLKDNSVAMYIQHMRSNS